MSRESVNRALNMVLGFIVLTSAGIGAIVGWRGL